MIPLMLLGIYLNYKYLVTNGRLDVIRNNFEIQTVQLKRVLKLIAIGYFCLTIILVIISVMIPGDI
jgi:hypothetical protein